MAVSSEINIDKSKVPVVLHDYKDGAIKMKLRRPEVTEDMVDKHLAEASKPYELVSVRFVEQGGAKLGNTVLCDWEPTYLEGGKQKHIQTGLLKPNSPIKGQLHENFELDLDLDQPEPFCSIAARVAKGMGQMESAMIEALFPEDYETPELQGVRARIRCLVRQIKQKVPREPDTRPIEDQRQSIRQELEAKTQAKINSALDQKIKQKLLASCEVDADKVVNSVSWAKFGEKSTQDFKWAVIQEKIASEENLSFSQVPEFLRKEAEITYV